MADSNQSTPTDDATPAGEPRRALARIAREVGTRMWDHLVLTGSLLIVIIGLGIGLSIVVPAQFRPPPPPPTLADALAALDAGQLDAARALAAELRHGEDLPAEQAGGPAYVLGVAMARDAADQRSRGERKARYLLAARHLEESRQAGFPAGRAAHGQLLLGQCLFRCGRFADAAAALEAALDANPDQRTEIYRLLTESHLRRENPHWEQALNFNGKYLTDDRLDAAARAAAQLQAATIHFELGDSASCQSVLARIDDSAPQYPAAMLLRGRLLVREADEMLAGAADGPAADAHRAAMARYDEAQQSLVEVGLSVKELAGQAQYLMGVCLRQRGEHDRAAEQFSLTRKTHFASPEGLAAGLAQAELEQLLGRDERAVALYRGVVRQAADVRPFSNPWVTLDGFRQRLEQAYRRYLDQGQFARAVAVAEALGPLFSPTRAVQLQAAAEKQWAQQLTQQVVQASSPAGEPRSVQARTTWRRAGQLYERLARLRFATRDYPEDLRIAADCYYRGHDYRRAVRLLERHLEYQPQRGRPPALTALGESLLALDQPDEALVWLMECIRFFPKDPHSYRARVVAAQAELERGNLAAAKQLLVGNLEHEALAPRSLEWRQSQYELGGIYYREGMQQEVDSRMLGVDSAGGDRKRGLKALEQARDSFQMAIVTLTEAVSRDRLAGRDPYARESIEARYLIADAYRQSAKFARRKLDSVTIETTRVSLNRQMQQDLTAAEAAYGELQQTLNAKQEQQELHDAEARMLRNCYYARADALFDLGQYEQAIKAYSTATHRYQYEPESLEAYVQIATCQRRMNLASKARGTLERAKVVLKEIPDDADFTRTTRYNRNEWEDLLGWLSAL